MNLASKLELPIIGSLPKQWTIAPLGELLEGGTRNGIYKSKEFHGRGAKIVNMGELFGNSRLGDIPMKRVELTNDELTKSSLKKGDLLFARRSLTAEGAGKCSIIRNVGEPTVFESSIIRARPNIQKVVPEFLYYVFQSSYRKYILDTIKRTVAVSGITGADLVTLQIPIPPIRTQRTIADKLTEIDDKIELNKKTNETLESMAKAIFKEWFIDFGPVKAKAEGKKPFGMDDKTASLFPDTFEDSELGQIPKGWKVKSLGDACDIIMGQSPPGDTYNENGNGMVFYQGRAEFGSRYPSPRLFCSEPSRIVKRGTVLLSVRAPVGDLNISTETQTCIGRGLAGILHKIGGTTFTYYLLQSLKDKFDMYNGEGTVFGSINKDTLSAIKVVSPPESVVTNFLNLVQPLDDLDLSNFEESRSLTHTRDLLLPKLISGEISLNDV
ncbi:MAG: restriction endonuclease subunit S [Bdellovibrionota bacterium]